MQNRLMFHPSLRLKPDAWLEPRASWFSFFYPAEERIGWYGDIQLLCREEDYQNVLDVVPCSTTPDANGNGRICALAGSDLDDYRTRVRTWLAQYDEFGGLRKGVPVPTFNKLESRSTTPPNVTAGPAAPKRAPWCGQKLSVYLRRGKPE